jgi:hypothetical protein
MTLTPYQIIVPLLAIFAMVYAWSLVFRQKKTIWEALLWTFFWGMIGYIAIYPNTLSYLSAVTGIKSQENAVIVTSIGILFFMVFYMIVRLEELEQRQTQMIRNIALRDAGLTDKVKVKE